MVTVIQKISPETSRRLVNVVFDKGMKQKPAARICKDEEEARSFVYRQYGVAIRVGLTRFAKQQLFIANKFPSMKGAPEKIDAARMIIDEMERLEFAGLEQISAVVYYLRHCITKLEPSPTSKYHHRYVDVIHPMISWSFYFSKKIRSRQLAAERSRDKPD